MKKEIKVGHKNTVIRAISKQLDRQLQHLFRQKKKEENKKARPKRITFIGVTQSIKVVKK